jgi:hypothetical protein
MTYAGLSQKSRVATLPRLLLHGGPTIGLISREARETFLENDLKTWKRG